MNVPHYPLCNSLLTDFLLVSNWNAFIGSKKLKPYTHTPHTFIQMCFICSLIIITTFICILLLSIYSGSNKNCIFSIPFSYGYLLWIFFYVFIIQTSNTQSYLIRLVSYTRLHWRPSSSSLLSTLVNVWDTQKTRFLTTFVE